MVFRLTAGNHPLFKFFIKYLYRSKPGSIGGFIDQYSKDLKESGRSVRFLQIGGNDGFSNDPIHKFIKRDAWQGVILEPLPDVFKEFLQPVYHLDQGVQTINAALGEDDGAATIYRIGFSKARWATGLTTFQKEVLVEAFRTGHVSRKAKKQGLKQVPTAEDGIVEEQIEVLSFNTLFNRYKLADTDLLQIDTEGFDFEIVKLIDFELMKPKVLIYEHVHLSGFDKGACAHYLADKGYKLREFGVNTLCTQLE